VVPHAASAHFADADGYRARRRIDGGGTQTGDAFDDIPIGSLPAGSGKTMRFTTTTVLKVENGLITEEIGLDDGVTVLQQLGLIKPARPLTRHTVTPLST
jgi:predicted ester cyclase